MSGQLATVVDAVKPEPSVASEIETGSLERASAAGERPPAPSTGRPALKIDQRALLCFYPDPLRPLTIQDIQRTLGVTYKPAYQALTGLAARGVLAEEKRSGWARYFRADCASPACAREFVLLEWARSDAFIPTLPDGERQRVEAFVRRAGEETTPLFIRTVQNDSAAGDPPRPPTPASGDENGTGRRPVQMVAVMARPEERAQLSLIARETALTVAVATLDVARHILTQRPDLATPLLQGVCLHGAEVFVQERFRALLARQAAAGTGTWPHSLNR